MGSLSGGAALFEELEGDTDWASATEADNNRADIECIPTAGCFAMPVAV